MDAKEISTLRSVLRLLPDIRGETRAEYNLNPAHGSQADRELSEQSQFAGEWSEEPVADCYTIAQSRLMAAIDHLEAFGDLIEDGTSVFLPDPSCGRSPGI
jgi:hypothetical protein